MEDTHQWRVEVVKPSKDKRKGKSDGSETAIQQWEPAATVPGQGKLTRAQVAALPPSGVWAGLPQVGQQETAEQHQPVPLKRAVMGNDDECARCHRPGLLVCCDGCVLAFHRKCLDADEGGWSDLPFFFCTACSREHVSCLGFDVDSVTGNRVVKVHNLVADVIMEVLCQDVPEQLLDGWKLEIRNARRSRHRRGR